MKKILFLFLLIAQVFFAQNSFDKGNILYKNGKYEQAIVAYEDVLKTEKKHSSDIYFNLGNCYYKLNKVAQAIYNYEKALVLKPYDHDVLNNLKFARKKTIDEVKELPKVGFTKLLRDFTGLYHYNTWGWISVGFSVLFLAFFIAYYFSKTEFSKRVFFLSMFFGVFCMLISLTAAFFEKSHFDLEKPAIIFAEITEIREEPRKVSAVVFVLHEGTKVYVLETVDKWRKVQLTDWTEGWLDASSIKEVK
jgi:tetratricopeptide (TPR) repeat protein